MKTYCIVFSPTGGTAKAAEAITAAWTNPEIIDLTDRELPDSLVLEDNSLALIAMPSFGGIAPQLALDRLMQIRGNGAKCAVAAVYGNRAYDDTLLQMKDTAEKAGFHVIAAIGAVAEHSIVRTYAANRPNTADTAELRSFGEKVLAKAEKEDSTVSVPGKFPYKKAGSAMVPKAGKACISCGLCAAKCPSGAILAANPRLTDAKACIGCMRCVSICPVQARRINPVMSKVVGLVLKKECSVPKKNELYL